MNEPKVLRYERTDYGKKIRKAYESGAVKERRCNMRTYNIRNDGLSNTLSTVTKDNYLCEPFIFAMRGRDPDDPSNRHAGTHTEQRSEPNTKGVTNTLTTVQKDNYLYDADGKPCRVRKLTPLEYYRLMGFSDTQFVQSALLCDRAEAKDVIMSAQMLDMPLTQIVMDRQAANKKNTTSNTQLYKQAGNSIVVDVMEHLLLNVRAAVPEAFGSEVFG